MNGIALVRFKDTPRFAWLAARADYALSKGWAVQYIRWAMEWDMNVAYALMPPLYGKPLFNMRRDP